MSRLQLLTISACVLLAAHAARAQSESSGPKVGDPAPPLDLEELLQAPAGAKAGWESLKGKVVVLEFWATWCTPCLAAIPHMNDLAEHFKDKPIQFIAVTDESKDVIEPFLKKASMHAWIGLDTDKSTWRTYGIRAVPRVFLIDKDGEIAAVTHPASLDEGALRNMLAGKPPGLKPLHRPVTSAPETELTEASSAEPPIYQVLIRPARSERGGARASSHGLTASGVSLESLVELAYVQLEGAFEAYGSPDWPNDRVILPPDFPAGVYDVEITIPRGGHPVVAEELRRALELTFGIRARIEAREVSAFVLTRLDGQEPQLAASESQPGAPRHCRKSAGSIQAPNATLRELAQHLRSVVGCDVFDETSIEGRYDFDLQWPVYGREALVEAIRATYKLDLKATRRPAKFLVVECGQEASRD